MLYILIIFLLDFANLPDEKYCHYNFLAQLISGEKSYLTVEGIVKLKVPKTREFTVENIYRMFATDQQFMRHLPDLHLQSKLPDRTWVMETVCTLRWEIML
jgi:hypothetical protein